MDQNISTQFGFSWPLFIAQLFFLLAVLVTVVLAIRATVVAARTFPSGLAPWWILLAWLLPVIGPVAVFIAAKRRVQVGV